MKLLPIGVALLALPLFAGKKPEPTPQQQADAHIQEMKDRVARDSDKELCIHSAELVRDLVERFNTEMSAGDLQAAQSTLGDIVTYAGKAGEGADKSKHKLKQAELMLHHALRRLKDIQQSLAVANRPAVDPAIKKMEAADDELLKRVFKE
jgi:hypothetical protein